MVDHLIDIGSVANVVASTSGGLHSALEMAEPGDVLEIRLGRYTGDFTIEAGSKNSPPITILCDDQSLFMNSVFKLHGDNIRLIGGQWSNSVIEIHGDYNRVSRVLMYDGNPGGNSSRLHSAIAFMGGASFNRVDHNEITKWQRRGIRHMNMTERTSDNWIDHNYLHDFRGDWGNSGEAIQLGTGDNNAEMLPRTIVEYNIIDGFELEGEIISIKSRDNTIRYNLIKDAPRSWLSLRSCSECRIVGNMLVGTKGIIVQGDSNVINGNLLDGGIYEVRSGDCTSTQIMATPPKFRGGHPAAQQAFMVGNVGSMTLGKAGTGKIEYYDIQHLPASHTRIFEHAGDIDTVGKAEATTYPLIYYGKIAKPITAVTALQNAGRDGIDPYAPTPPNPIDTEAIIAMVTELEEWATNVLDVLDIAADIRKALGGE